MRGRPGRARGVPPSEGRGPALPLIPLFGAELRCGWHPGQGPAPKAGRTSMVKGRARMQRLEDVDDAALVLAVARYWREAWPRRTGGAVFALARRVTADSHLAEEVVQEVFLGAVAPAGPVRRRPGVAAVVPSLPGAREGRGPGPLGELAAAPGGAGGALRAESGYDIEREVWDMAVAEGVRTAGRGGRRGRPGSGRRRGRREGRRPPPDTGLREWGRAGGGRDPPRRPGVPGQGQPATASHGRHLPAVGPGRTGPDLGRCARP
jgi:hypothetical protein